MWHDEENLKEYVILDPIKFFVEPLTNIICKFNQTGTDPTIHEKPIHKKAFRQFTRKFADLTDNGHLAHSLLVFLLSDYQIHFDVLLLLMKKYGFLVEIKPKLTIDISNNTKETYYIVPSLLPDRQGQQQMTYFPLETKFYFALTLDSETSSNMTYAFAEHLEKTCNG